MRDRFLGRACGTAPLALSILLSVAGCGGSEDGGKPAVVETTEAKKTSDLIQNDYKGIMAKAKGKTAPKGAPSVPTPPPTDN